MSELTTCATLYALNARGGVRSAASTTTRLASSSSAPPLVDIDCNFLHSDLPPFPLLLSHPSTISANVEKFVSPSSSLAEYSKLKTHLDTGLYDNNIRTTVGIHPYSAPSELNVEETDKFIRENLNSKFVSCVGECGLDFSDGFPPSSHQIPVFKLQVEIAVDTQTPLFIHTRLAHAETLEILDSFGER